MVSGGVLFNSILGMDYHTGLWIVTGVVVAYTLFGGFLAVSWTDFVQGIIMFAALILVPIVTFFHTGGAGDTVAEIRSVDPDMFNIFKGTSVLGIISLFAYGGWDTLASRILLCVLWRSRLSKRSKERAESGWAG